jgi:hypothetical protein
MKKIALFGVMFFLLFSACIESASAGEKYVRKAVLKADDVSSFMNKLAKENSHDDLEIRIINIYGVQTSNEVATVFYQQGYKNSPEAEESVTLEKFTLNRLTDGRWLHIRGREAIYLTLD